MSSRKTLILIASIGVGVFAGIALLNYVRGIERDVYDDAQPVEVLIATAEIPEGTPVAEAFNMIVRTEVPLKIRPSTYIPPDNTDQITGLVARGNIPTNQIIVAGLFVDPSVVSASLRDQLPDGTVAFSMEIDNTRAVGGYLQPGDEVNLMIQHENVCSTDELADELADELIEAVAVAPEGEFVFGEEYCTYTNVARYIYQRVEILAIGARQALPTGQTSDAALIPQGGTITFLLPNEAAQLLASISPELVYLTLLPDSYEAEVLPALSGDLLAGPTPAEIEGCATPYGPDGFIEGDSAVVADETAGSSVFVDGHCLPLQDGGE